MFDSDCAKPLTSTTSATITKHQSLACPTLQGSLSPAISDSCALLYAFLHAQKKQPPCFQSFPHSASKNTTGGSTPTRFEDQNEATSCLFRYSVSLSCPSHSKRTPMPSRPAL